MNLFRFDIDFVEKLSQEYQGNKDIQKLLAAFKMLKYENEELRNQVFDQEVKIEVLEDMRKRLFSFLGRLLLSK